MDDHLVRAQPLYVMNTRLGSQRVGDENEQGNAESQAGPSRKWRSEFGRRHALIIAVSPVKTSRTAAPRSRPQTLAMCETILPTSEEHCNRIPSARRQRVRLRRS